MGLTQVAIRSHYLSALPESASHPSVMAFLAAVELVLNKITGCISGLVVEYIVVIDVTRARFPADAVAGVILNVDVVICATRHI